MPAIRQHFAVQPLLEGLIAAPADIGAVDETLSTELHQLLSSSVLLPEDVLKDGERMSMWELRAGEARDLDRIFSVVAGSQIKCLTIWDPYCGAKSNRGKLRSFLYAISALAKHIEHVAIHCKEYRDKDGDVEFHLDVERHLDDILASLRLLSSDVKVRRLKESGRTFHDRTVDATIIADDGCETLHRFFLTGGIDYLMDERSETRIFYRRP
ncbi:hypothetical protein FNU76_23520 [Chitinimonas arctica]|uniref:Uncharacterized protein n=1 Tax=Chitinimonas arctica TaxID=2594795 RepID=A0A516SLS1_9NEIS|nr:hypothetical protein [Chitinimonas arctica]QDQ29080.1 hypothetical protein FNU76_23520 [Chitinimonas arctica]